VTEYVTTTRARLARALLLAFLAGLLVGTLATVLALT